MNKKILFIIPVILILVGSLLLIPVSQASSPITPDGTVAISGHVLPDGDLALFYFNSPTGINVIHSSTVIPVNKIELDLYSLKAQNLTITVSQFSGYTVHNVTTRISNNSTITTPVKTMNNPVYANETIKTQYRQLETFSITLPSTSSSKNVSITIDNSTYLMVHKTSPNIVPNYISGLGQLGETLLDIFMGVIIFFVSTLTADLLLKRMKYWPPFGKLGWMVILIFLLMAMVMIVLSDYYQLAYIKWYYWLIPFYVFATLAMLEIWPQSWEKWFVFITGDGDKTEWDAEFPRVSKIHGGYEYIRPGRKAALKRLIWHIPVSFNLAGQVDGIPLTHNTERISQFFIAKDEPYYQREEIEQPQEEGKKHRIHIKHKPKIRAYTIPLTLHHTKPIAEFLGELRAVVQFASENESLEEENLQLKIRIEKSGIQANRVLVDEIMDLMKSKKISPKFVQAQEEKKEEKKDEGEK